MHKLLAAVTVLAVSTAQAGVIYVDIANCPGPGDGSEADPYCSIQTAIDNAAMAGDDIVVAPGTYLESINFLGKAITLRSSGGPDVTTIDAGGFGGFGTVVTCESGEGADTVLESLTITGAFSVYGGGMFNDGSSPTVIDCVFAGNWSGVGGGIHNEGGSPTVIGCVFLDNTADSGGGGMYNDGSSPTVIDCTFEGNGTIVPGDGGGGMFNFMSSPTVIGCTFRGNVAILQLAVGGGMLNAASDPIIGNCLFESNVSNTGSGIFNSASNPTIVNCTFTGNFGDVIGNASSSHAVVTNCVLWGNPFSAQIADARSSPSTVSHSNVEGGWSGAGSDNIDADPLFGSTSDCCVFHLGSGCDDPECTAAVCDVEPGCCDKADGIWSFVCVSVAMEVCSVCPIDSRLQPGSPCIDAGDDTAVPMGVLRDLDGNPRFVADACAGDSGSTVDMGAYEFQGTSCDLGTMMQMLAAWGYCDDCRHCRYDFDRDCSVGILDLLVLLENRG